MDSTGVPASTSFGHLARVRKTKAHQHPVEQVLAACFGYLTPTQQKAVRFLLWVCFRAGVSRIDFGVSQILEHEDWLKPLKEIRERDTVQRVLRILEADGYAVEISPYIKGGHDQKGQAATWRVDFSAALTGINFFMLPEAQAAPLLRSTSTSKKSTKPKQQSPQARRARLVCASPAHDPKWDECLGLLRGTGERVWAVAAEKLTGSGRTPDEALTILTGALGQAADRQAKGEKIGSVVGYALSAIPVGGWGEVFLRPPQAEPNAPESLAVAPEETRAAAAILVEEICITPRDAEAEVARITGPIRQEGPVAAVEIAIKLARKRAVSGHVGSFGGLVRHFLRGAQAPEIQGALRHARWARECLSQAQAPQQALKAAMGQWAQVVDQLRSAPRAQTAFGAWQRLRAQTPAPDSPGYLEHFDAERQAYRAFVAVAEAALGPNAAGMQADLAARLRESGIQPETPVWKRVWDHHWNRLVCEHWGLQC